MNRFRAAAFAVAFLVACSQENQTVDTTTTQTPSQPTGSVVGVVTSLRTGAPLQGVTVLVPSPAGLVSATTDAAGAYALRGLVAGATYVVRFAMAGYVPRFASATIPNTAGDFPSDGIAQLNMPLAQANATLNGHVYARDGAPAQGVVLTVDLRDQGFDFVASATTDAQGAYSLTGLPGAPEGLAVEVVVQPWDANGDGVADYNALSRTGMIYPSATSLLDFDLRSAAAELLLLTSNLESGVLAVDAAIQLTFNRPLDANLTAVSLYDSTVAKTVAVTVSLDGTGKILTIVPAGATTLAAFHAYSLSVAAVATNGDTLMVSRAFTAEVPATVLPAVTGLTVTPANADFDTASFTLSWKFSPGASKYQVWVRDTSRNPDYLLMQTLGSSPAPSTSVTLPLTFDYYSADGIQTPFAFGVGVDFAVVAVNAAGDVLSPSAVTPVHRTDTVKPPVEQVAQSVSADNSAGASPRTITLTLTFGEYMDPAVVPTIALPKGTMTSTFAWNPNQISGTFSITIPASTDGSGTYTVSGAKDSSGNTMTVYSGNLWGSLPPVTGLMVTPANADFDTASFTLSWNASTGASGYQVWVRDTKLNPSYLLVKTVGGSTTSTTVPLPAAFDWSSADGIQTPFAFGVGVDFAVVAVNPAGEGLSPSAVTPVRRTDTVKPVVEQVAQSASADNSAGGSPLTITLTLTFGEYMDPAVVPTIALPNAGMTSAFAWNPNQTVGTFSITIPASIDGRGTYTVSGAKDSSGNTMATSTGTLTSMVQVQLVANGGFEAGALTDWTTSYTGTATAPVATSSVAATGTYSAQVGNETTSTQGGYSTLYQNVTLPSGYTSIVASVAYRPYTNYSYSGHDWSACYIQNSTGSTTYVTIFSTYQNSTSFSTATANITAYGGQTVRIMCQAYQDSFHITGMYLDNVSILATP